MTADGRKSFQKLAIGKVFDFRSPLETTRGVHGYSVHADSGVASLKEPHELESMLLATDVEVIAALVFPDEEWLHSGEVSG